MYKNIKEKKRTQTSNNQAVSTDKMQTVTSEHHISVQIANQHKHHNSDSCFHSDYIITFHDEITLLQLQSLFL